MRRKSQSTNLSPADLVRCGWSRRSSWWCRLRPTSRRWRRAGPRVPPCLPRRPAPSPPRPDTPWGRRAAAAEWWVPVFILLKTALTNKTNLESKIIFLVHPWEIKVLSEIEIIVFEGVLLSSTFYATRIHSLMWAGCKNSCFAKFSKEKVSGKRFTWWSTKDQKQSLPSRFLCLSVKTSSHRPLANSLFFICHRRRRLRQNFFFCELVLVAVVAHLFVFWLLYLLLDTSWECFPETHFHHSKQLKSTHTHTHTYTHRAIAQQNYKQRMAWQKWVPACVLF